MKAALWLLVGVVTIIVCSIEAGRYEVDPEDNEFAEFEEFDEEDNFEEDERVDDTRDKKYDESQNVGRKDTTEPEEEDDDEASIETEDDEFEHFQDEEEFEGFDKDREKTKTPEGKPNLEIAKIPLHLRTNWDSFYMEMLMLAGLGAYFLNFLAGKTKNHKLAQAWLSSHRDILESNFSVVGDDGQTKEVQSGILMKESENVYALWCSGRVGLEGLLVELKLVKRQDLVNCISRMFKPTSDQIIITVDMDPTTMPKMVFAVALKKICGKLHKDLNDLSQFCSEKKGTEKLDVPNTYQLLSEIGEATQAILDKKVRQMLTEFEGLIEYIHVSDQYSGPKLQDADQSQAKMPQVKSVIIFCFNVAGKGKSKTSDMENMKPLLRLVFHCIDKVGRLQLSREASVKAEKNRQKAEEAFVKQAHAQRQEAAQKRREEKHRAEKEKMLAEEDPDKARKLEERESKREMKRKQPKMKLMKI